MLTIRYSYCSTFPNQIVRLRLKSDRIYAVWTHLLANRNAHPESRFQTASNGASAQRRIFHITYMRRMCCAASALCARNNTQGIIIIWKIHGWGMLFREQHICWSRKQSPESSWKTFVCALIIHRVTNI